VNDVEARKRALRVEARRIAARRGADPDQAAAAARALLGQPELARLRAVSLYVALAAELPTVAILRELRERGHRVALPRVTATGLELRLFTGCASLVPGYRGLLEPEADAPAVGVEEVDLFVVPGLLFDRSGRRLGRGGGHYDRLLTGARDAALRVGLCYAEQVVEVLPESPWDVRMHRVIAGAEVFTPGDRA
jgi:5-formyltetrahydrofolate cyclo-ligase